MSKKFFYSVFLFLFCINVKAQVVINEIYGGGGNSGSVFRNDFIELYNSGNTSVSLNGWSVQYSGKNGTSWSVTPLTGSIPAKGFFLIQQAAGGQGTSYLPDADVIGNIAMAASDGKVALVNNTTPLSGSCPKTQSTVVDFVGYGGADCSVGSAAPPPNNVNSIERNPAGVNTGNNFKDFTAGVPTPSNKTGIDNDPPTILALQPTFGATNASTSLMAVITFDEPIKKGNTGNIIVKRISDQVVVENISVNNTAVHIENSKLFFPINALAFQTAYSVEITQGTVSDLFGNNFLGVSSGTWNFTTGVDKPRGTLNIAYDFNDCSRLFNSFSAYNFLGEERWGCSAYGLNQSDITYNYPFEGAAYISGFSGGMNSPNEDWLISPSFDLSETIFPVLSFWSKTTGIGNSLQLKVSVDYPGFGNPNDYQWKTISGYFPEKNSKQWTLSEFISLENFKSSNTYFAFVYTSTLDGAANWSLDNIIVQNLYSAPPPVLNLRKSKIKFGYVPVAQDSTIQFNFTPNYLLGDVTVTAPQGFSISRDGINFSSSIQYFKNLSNNISQNLFIRFTPTARNQDYSDRLVFSSQGMADAYINVSGTSTNYDLTLEVVNWNIEWFGINNTAYGPTNKELQETNIRTITRNIGADIYGLVEVVSEPRLKNIVNSLNDEFGEGVYDYVICDYGSYSNPYKAGTIPLDQLQKEAFIYKTSVIQPIEPPMALVTDGPNTPIDVKNPAYSYFSSGRYPYMLYANVTLGNITEPVRFVLLHAKANTNPVDAAYQRRKKGADTLNYTLNNLFPDDKIILLGDFNDDLNKTITYGYSESSYSVFNNDSLRFFSPTLALSLAGYQSTVNYKNIIDHVEISNEMKPYYIPNSAKVITEVTSMVSNYGTTTTDHYPILTRYAFDPNVLPVKLTTFTAVKKGEYALLEWATAEEKNSEYFEVQKSNDSKTWTSIGKINAHQNATTLNRYQFTDTKPQEGINYYRLKMMDKDGHFTYSAIRSLVFKSSLTLRISPNPAQTSVTIDLGKKHTVPVSILINDVNGKTVWKETTNSQAYTLQVSGWRKGMYFVQIQIGNENVTQKLLIQ